MSSVSYGVHVDTHGLDEKFAAFTDTQARRAMRSAMNRVTVRGRNLVRAKTPVKSGVSKAGIRASTRGSGSVVIGRIYAGGPHAHITRWQDQGTGPRHKRSNGQYTGIVEPQYMFERGKTELEPLTGPIFDEAITAALARSGLK